MVMKLHHALSDESTQASTVLLAWSEIPGLIPEADIISIFKDKGGRLKGKGNQSKDVDTVVSVSDDEDED